MRVNASTAIEEIRELLSEGVRFKGKVEDWEKVLFKAFVVFMGGKDVVLKERKRASKYFGFVRPGKEEIEFESGGTKVALKYIAHELTHLKQIRSGDLEFEEGMILWKGEPIVSIKDYNKMGYKDWSKLPFEREAIIAAETKPAEFLQTRLDGLRGIDKTLDFLIDNGLI